MNIHQVKAHCEKKIKALNDAKPANETDYEKIERLAKTVAYQEVATYIATHGLL